MTPLRLPSRSDIAGIGWPPVIDGGGAVLAAMLAQLEQTQWLSPAEIDARQRTQLGIVAEHAIAHAPHFAARMARAGLDTSAIAAPGGLARLEPLTRQALQAAAGVHCEVVPDRHAPIRETRTSGSTGEPVVVRRTAVSQLDWLATTMRDHLWHHRDFATRMATVRAHVTRIETRSDWGQPATLLFDTGPCLNLPISIDAAALRRLLIDFDPVSLLIYPSTLAALGDEMARGAERLTSLRQIRTIGETLAPDARACISEIFGIDPIDCYSSQEVGTIALRCPDGPGYHVMAETMIVEIVDDDGQPCAPGEIGRVLITDLHNFATPLVRYEIGDHAQAGGPCACGRGLPTLERILGRERNLVRMPNGTRHWPQVGFAGFRAIAPIGQYQLLQHSLERIEVRLVTERALTAAEERRLADHIGAALGHGFAIDFAYFAGRLPVGRNGKFEEFKCLIDARG